MKTRRSTIFLILVIIITAPFIFNNIIKKKINHKEFNLQISSPLTPIPFKVGVQSGPIDLDPQLAWDQASYDVIDQVCEGLFTYNLSHPELKIIPHLASDYGEWNPSGTEFTVPLRQGIIFHDRTPFNADTVNFTWQRMAWALNSTGTNFDKVTQLSPLYTFLNGTPIVQRVRKNNDYNVTFILNAPYVPLEALLCFSGSYILSPNSTPVASYIDTTVGNLVGTGPFVYDYYIVNSEINFHAFNSYWRGKTTIDKMVFSIIPSYNLLKEALLYENIHFVSGIPLSMLSTFTAHPHITVLDSGKTSKETFFVGMNTILINRTFREAISYAINYSYINDEINIQSSVRLRSPLPSGIRYANDTFDVAVFNLTRARIIMQSMGFGEGWDPTYPGTNEIQWLNATFATFNYTYTTNENILVLLQNNLAKIGIQITNASTTYLEFLNIMREIDGHHRNELQLYFFAYSADFNDPSNLINFLFSNRTILGNGAQYNGYTEAQMAGRDPFYLWDNVQLLMEEALKETNPIIRESMYDRIQELLIEDKPCVWCWVPKLYHVHHINLTGYQQNAFNKLDLYSCNWVAYTPLPPIIVHEFFIPFIVTLLFLVSSIGLSIILISTRRIRNLEFLKEKKRMFKSLPRKKEQREKLFEKFFNEYREKTLKVSDLSRNFEYASDLLKEDVNELASIKITPLEYRNDLKNVNNKTYEGFNNSRVYSDEYKELREYIISKKNIKNPVYCQLETWKRDNDTLIFDHKGIKLLLIEHQTGLEIYFKAEVLRNYLQKLIEEFLKELTEDILKKVIEDFLEEVIDKLIDIIDDHIKKKKKGKCVNRVSKPDKFSIELRHLKRVIKILKIKGKKIYDQFKQELISLKEKGKELHQ
ncbi:MAG: ABC transporter substrate-binding protein [Promethearchaeota archaeon]